MYTGIVQGAYKVIRIRRQSGLHTLTVALDEVLMRGLSPGASVALDGVCLTVTRFDEREVDFDVMQETLQLTTLGQLEEGDRVNVERSARHGAEIGGHILSGHVDTTAVVVAIEKPDNNCFVSYHVDKTFLKYLFKKGFVALNGCSLTVADLDRGKAVFKVCYIPETLRVTTHGEKLVGDRVNVELDRQTQVIVDTVERLLQENPQLFTSSVQGHGDR